jgi:hypothetical protein
MAPNLPGWCIHWINVLFFYYKDLLLIIWFFILSKNSRHPIPQQAFHSRSANDWAPAPPRGYWRWIKEIMVAPRDFLDPKKREDMIEFIGIERFFVVYFPLAVMKRILLPLSLLVTTAAISFHHFAPKATSQKCFTGRGRTQCVPYPPPFEVDRTDPKTQPGPWSIFDQNPRVSHYLPIRTRSYFLFLAQGHPTQIWTYVSLTLFVVLFVVWQINGLMNEYDTIRQEYLIGLVDESEYRPELKWFRQLSVRSVPPEFLRKLDINRGWFLHQFSSQKAKLKRAKRRRFQLRETQRTLTELFAFAPGGIERAELYPKFGLVLITFNTVHGAHLAAGKKVRGMETHLLDQDFETVGMSYMLMIHARHQLRSRWIRSTSIAILIASVTFINVFFDEKIAADFIYPLFREWEHKGPGKGLEWLIPTVFSMWEPHSMPKSVVFSDGLKFTGMSSTLGEAEVLTMQVWFPVSFFRNQVLGTMKYTFDLIGESVNWQWRWLFDTGFRRFLFVISKPVTDTFEGESGFLRPIVNFDRLLLMTQLYTFGLFYKRTYQLFRFLRYSLKKVLNRARKKKKPMRNEAFIQDPTTWWPNIFYWFLEYDVSLMIACNGIISSIIVPLFCPLSLMAMGVHFSGQYYVMAYNSPELPGASGRLYLVALKHMFFGLYSLVLTVMYWVLAAESACEEPSSRHCTDHLHRISAIAVLAMVLLLVFVAHLWSYSKENSLRPLSPNSMVKISERKIKPRPPTPPPSRDCSEDHERLTYRTDRRLPNNGILEILPPGPYPRRGNVPRRRVQRTESE